MSNGPDPRNDLRHAGRYEVRVKGRLDSRWAARFDGMSLRPEPGGVTVLRGLVVDQAALHGLLQRVRDIGLPLVSVTRVSDEDHPDPRATTEVRSVDRGTQGSDQK